MTPDEKKQFDKLVKKVAEMERLMNQYIFPDRYQFDLPVRFTGNKIGFFNVPMVIQPIPTGITTGMTIAGGATVTEANAFTGGYPGTSAYTIADTVKGLKDVGILKK